MATTLPSTRGTALVNMPLAPPTTPRQFVARMLGDRLFRTRVIVHDNFQAVLDNARETMHITGTPSHAELVSRIMGMRDPELQALVLDVPYIGNVDPLWDQGWQLMQERAVASPAPHGTQRIVGVIAGLLGAVTAIIGGNNANDAAEDQQALLEMQLQAQREADAARKDRLQRIGTYLLYAAAFAVALTIIYLTLRKPKAIAA